MAKIREIIATRDRMGSTTPAVQLNFVVTRFNENERDDFRKLADELGCQTVFSIASMNVRFTGQDRNLTNLGLAPDLKQKLQREHVEKWLPRDTDFALEPYRRILDGNYDPDDFNGTKLYDCEWPWRAAVINWDGNVVVCCGSFDPDKDMGNVFDTKFGRIWNGHKYLMARRSYKKRLDPEHARNNPCASCPGVLI